MKKIICSLIASAIFACAAFAVPTEYNESHKENWSEISYFQVPIYKVLDSKDGYVIIYAKNRVGVGKTVIPKKWAKNSTENPRKLRIQSIGSGKLKPFMTVVQKSGEFNHVILTLPKNKSDPVWGVVDYRKEVEGTDKETLEELDL
ncbi:MAG: hypothetical protein UHP28_03440 [Treponema sp.]|nr:hypothetical protein [Treponema sp.]